MSLSTSTGRLSEEDYNNFVNDKHVVFSLTRNGEIPKLIKDIVDILVYDLKLVTTWSGLITLHKSNVHISIVIADTDVAVIHPDDLLEHFVSINQGLKENNDPINQFDLSVEKTINRSGLGPKMKYLYSLKLPLTETYTSARWAGLFKTIADRAKEKQAHESQT